MCVHEKHIQRHFTLLQRSEEEKHLHSVSGAENFFAFINYTAATNVWRAETSGDELRASSVWRAAARGGAGATEGGEFQRGKKNCDVINAYPHVWF